MGIIDTKIFVDRLEAAWNRMSQQRFGQFMSNVLGQYVHDTGQDIFFVSNAELIAYIEWYVNGGASPFNYGPRPGDIERGNHGQ